MLGIYFNVLLFILQILSGITVFTFLSDYLINTLKAEAGSRLEKPVIVIGNEETNSFNYSINHNVIFLVQVPRRKLSG